MILVCSNSLAWSIVVGLAWPLDRLVVWGTSCGSLQITMYYEHALDYIRSVQFEDSMSTYFCCTCMWTCVFVCWQLLFGASCWARHISLFKCGSLCCWQLCGLLWPFAFCICYCSLFMLKFWDEIRWKCCKTRPIRQVFLVWFVIGLIQIAHGRSGSIGLVLGGPCGLLWACALDLSIVEFPISLDFQAIGFCFVWLSCVE